MLIHQFEIEDSDNPTKRNIGAAVANLKQELEQHGKTLPTQCVTSLSQGYCPKIDTMPELDEKRANCYYYQCLIGIVSWIYSKLGRVDILVPVAMLSRYLAAPREEHLDSSLSSFRRSQAM